MSAFSGYANNDFDVLFSLTLKNYRKRLTDNITNKHVLFKQMKDKDFIKVEDGSPSIVEPLLYGVSTNVESYSGYDILKMDPQKGISAAEFPWRQMYGTVAYSGEEEFKNMGSNVKLQSIVDAKVKQLEISFSLKLNQKLVGDGSGNGGKDFHGLALLVEATTGSWSTVGGIDPNTPEGAFWVPTTINMTGTTWAAKGLDKMRHLYNDVSAGGVYPPKLIISTQDIYEAYERNITPQEIYIDKETADAGFIHIAFKKVPWVFDEHMTVANGAPSASYLYMLNSDFMKLIFGKGRNFTMTPFELMPWQDAKSARMYLFGNFTIFDRRRQGCIFNVTIS